MIQTTTDRNIFKLLEKGITSRKLALKTCLDVGCGMNPVNNWFHKNSALSDGCYYAIDSHPVVRQELLKKGINVMAPLEVPDLFETDLVIAMEIIEHIVPDEIEEFLVRLRKWTGKVLALTCPNFSGLDPVRGINNDKEIRFVPDHLKNFNPGSVDPYMHKTAITPEMLLTLLERAYPSPEWSVSVYKAWPWLLSDIPTGRFYLVYFKIFGLVWKN